MPVSNSIKFQRVTLYICYEPNSRGSYMEGLDHIVGTLEDHLEPECRLLDYHAEEYQLVPIPTAEEA